jgi:hypothetical protein
MVAHGAQGGTGRAPRRSHGPPSSAPLSSTISALPSRNVKCAPWGLVGALRTRRPWRCTCLTHCNQTPSNTPCPWWPQSGKWYRRPKSAAFPRLPALSNRAAM